MIKGISTVIGLMFSVAIFAQEDELQLISENACNCLSKVSTSLQDEKKLEKIKECISSITLQSQIQDIFLMTLQSPTDADSIVNSKTKDANLTNKESDFAIETNLNYAEIEEILLADCPEMRLLLSSKDEKSKYSVSKKKEAQKFYDNGQGFFAKEQYEKAIVEYEKAIEKDENFAFAWDMLGYSHRRLNKYEEAIGYYKKSLQIDPKGKMPLGNIPYTYELLKQYDNAIKAYAAYAAIYPDDPESYYGVGRLYHQLGDYENALDNTMKAYIIYKEMNSPYFNDAKHNIALFYNELKEKDQLELFRKMAEKYDIQMEE